MKGLRLQGFLLLSLLGMPLAHSAALSVIHLSVKFNKEIGLQKLFRTNQLKTLEDRINLFVTFGFYLGIYVLTIVILIVLYR